MKLSGLIPMAVKLTRKSSSGWREDSTTGSYTFDTRPLTEQELKARDEEIVWANHRGKAITITNGHLAYGPKSSSLIENGRPTGLLNHLIRRERLAWAAGKERLAGVDLTATDGSYAGPGALANAQALAAVTGGTANVAWWAPAVYTPIAANAVKAPQAWRCTASGLITSSAGSQTVIMNPAVGTAVAGQVLGASSALTLGTTITNAFWRLAYELTVRTPGSSGTAVGNGLMHWGTTAGASSTVSNALMSGGNTVATADFQTTAQGLLIAATPNATAISVTPTMVQFVNWD